MVTFKVLRVFFVLNSTFLTCEENKHVIDQHFSPKTARFFRLELCRIPRTDFGRKKSYILVVRPVYSSIEMLNLEKSCDLHKTHTLLSLSRHECSNNPSLETPHRVRQRSRLAAYAEIPLHRMNSTDCWYTIETPNSKYI